MSSGDAKTPGVVPPSAPPAPKVRPRSLVLVNTGEGKGKSTAAFGVVMRAVARDWRVCVIQFVKSDRWKVGEEKIARQLGVDWLKGGDGFTWESPDLEKSEGRALAAWQLAAAAIAGGEYQLVVLDEITYPMNWAWTVAFKRVAGSTSDGARRSHRRRAQRQVGARTSSRPGGERACDVPRDWRGARRRDGAADRSPSR